MSELNESADLSIIGELKMTGIETGELRTKSGNVLEVEKGMGFLKIQDGNYLMSAEINDDALSMSLFTKVIPTQKYHPDMRAAKFVDIALKMFEEQRLSFSMVKNTWMEGSETYDRFMKALDETGSSIAAAESLNPPQLHDLGFAIVSEDDVRVYDYKKQNPDTKQPNAVYTVFRRQDLAREESAA